MRLGAGYSLAKNSQWSSNNQEAIVDERMTVELIGNTLESANIIETTITVLNFDRTMTYDEGIDYELVISGSGQVELLFFSSHLSGNIQLGDELSIDYVHRVNSFVEYHTKSHNYLASLNLFDRALLIYAEFSQSDPELIAGEADLTPLERTRYSVLGVESKLGEHEIGCRYMNLDSSYSNEESYNLFWRYSTDCRGGKLNVNLENTYRMYSATLLDAQYQSENEVVTNAISFRADYRRKLNKFIQMELDSYVYDVRGDYGDQTDISLGIKLEAMLYRLKATLEGEVAFQIDENQTRRNDSLRLNVKRNF